jgi:tetratricopeptide (TPR) repeat protein
MPDFTESNDRFLIAAAALLYCVLLPQHYIGFMEDDAMYVLGAKALTGGRYVLLNAPDHPPQNLALPGFPLFLAPFVKLVDPHWAWLKWVPLGLLLFSAMLLWKLLEPWTPSVWRSLSLGLFLFNPLTVEMSHLVLSESCFLALSLLILSELDPVVQGKTASWTPWALGLGLGWLAVMRPEGFLWVLSVGLVLISRRNWKMLLQIICTAMVPIIGWAARNYLLTGSISGYAALLVNDQGSILPAMGLLAYQGWKFLQAVGISTLACLPKAPGGSGLQWLQILILAGIMVLIGWGVSRTWKKHSGNFIWVQSAIGFCAFYFLLHSGIAFVDPRYVLPILPFAVFFLIQGFREFIKVFPSLSKSACLLMFILGCHYAYQDVTKVYQTWTGSNPRPYNFPAQTLAWVRKNLPSDARILTNKAAAIFLYTGRYTASAPGAMNAEEFRFVLLKGRVSNILLRPQTLGELERMRFWKNLEKWIRAWPEAFPISYDNSTEGATVYQVKSDMNFEKAYGLVQEAMKDLQHPAWEPAFDKLNKALRLYPALLYARNVYGTALLIHGRNLRWAEQMLQYVNQRRPDDPIVLLNLGRLYQRTDRLAMAEDYYEKAANAVRLTPERKSLMALITQEQSGLNALRQSRDVKQL